MIDEKRFRHVTNMGGNPLYMDLTIEKFVTLDSEGKATLASELDIELVGAPTNLNPWVAVNSASRQQMQASHLKQRLVTEGVTVRRNITGTEREYGKYTFNQRIPVNATILGVFPKYARQAGLGSILENPSTLVVYEDFETKEIGSVLLEEYFFQHTSLGWKYRKTDNVHKVVKGATIGKNTVLHDSPCVDREGNYMYGIETNVAYMTVPGIIEDGFEISESYQQKLATTMLGTRQASCGKSMYPLNLYGNENHYKPFPGPGERIRDDGLVMAFRAIDSNTTISDLHPRNLLGDRTDFEFDKTIYAQPGAKIVDVDVLTDHNARYRTTPTGMEKELEKYCTSKDLFYTKIIELYQSNKRKRAGNLDITPEFHSWVVEALANFPDSSKERVVRIKNKTPLDDFNIEITYAYRKVPTIGYKITDTHGTKGVIVGIRPDADMPTTATGIVADVIKDPLSVIKRSNVGQIFEQWTNQASTQAVVRIRACATLADGWNMAMNYYKAAAPYMFWKCMKHLDTSGLQDTHIQSIMNPNVSIQAALTLLLPPDSPNIGIQQVKDIEANCKSIIGPVTYRGNSGKMITTKRPVAIDTKYMMLLDKTGEDWSTTSIAKRQHHGIIVQLGRADKYLNPYRESPVRFGESEYRAFAAFMHPDVVAEVSDRTNSLQSSEAVNWAILTADKPSAIHCTVDRNRVPRGNSRPLQLMKHLMICGGVGFKYAPYKPEIAIRVITDNDV